MKNSKRRRYADGGVEKSSDWIETVSIPTGTVASTGGTVGADPPLVPIGKPTYNEAIHDALVEVACASDPPPCQEPINLFDLMLTLQKHKRIPMEALYVPCGSLVEAL